ncbi:MAG: outer membrane lipoprotein-sorting protein [Bryobacterales bacterium]|nr:outer membrane lipoprotein-sorting protein [Bryobacterales bacterium]
MADSGGKVTSKRWISERLGAWGSSKTILRFTAPAEVKGVALLVLNQPDRSSDQWTWTPAIGRDRRIAMQDRSTRFFGTDFSFEDLEERDVDQSDFTLVGEEAVDGAACWRIEFRPRAARSLQYNRRFLWIRKDNYSAARVESYIKDQLVPRLNYRQIERVQNVWTARLLRMEDLRRKGKTVMRLEKLE